MLHVACGVWHTAAVAAQPLGMPAAGQPGRADVDPAEWEAIQQKMADAYRMLDEVSCYFYLPCKCLAGTAHKRCTPASDVASAEGQVRPCSPFKQTDEVWHCGE